MNKESVIIFHITKTAGTALRAILYKHCYGVNYRGDTTLDGNTSLIYPYYNFYGERSGARPFKRNEETDKAKYFIGHLVYYGMDTGRPSKYVVFLREPVQRFLSLYNHLRIEHKRYNLQIPSFEEWFNGQKCLTQVWELTGQSDTTILNPSLDDAREILNKMSYIGLRETFEDDIHHLFKSNIFIKNINVNDDKAKDLGVDIIGFSDSELDMVNEAVSDDKKLYEYAIQLRKDGHNKLGELLLE